MFTLKEVRAIIFVLTSTKNESVVITNEIFDITRKQINFNKFYIDKAGEYYSVFFFFEYGDRLRLGILNPPISNRPLTLSPTPFMQKLMLSHGVIHGNADWNEPISPKMSKELLFGFESNFETKVLSNMANEVGFLSPREMLGRLNVMTSELSAINRVDALRIIEHYEKLINEISNLMGIVNER